MSQRTLNSLRSLSADVLNGPLQEHISAEAHSTKTISEAFSTSGQVQYVALAGTFREAGLPYTGRLRVLKTIQR